MFCALYHEAMISTDQSTCHWRSKNVSTTKISFEFGFMDQ